MIDDEICEHCDELDSRHSVKAVLIECLKAQLDEEREEFGNLMERTKDAERVRDRLYDERDQLRADLAAARARIAKLEARLEIDHCYDAAGNRVEIPPDERDGFPDGILARDCTIAGLREVRESALADLRERAAKVAAAEHRVVFARYAAVQAGLHDPGDGPVAAAIRALPLTDDGGAP